MLFFTVRTVQRPFYLIDLLLFRLKVDVMFRDLLSIELGLFRFKSANITLGSLLAQLVCRLFRRIALIRLIKLEVVLVIVNAVEVIALYIFD